MAVPTSGRNDGNSGSNQDDSTGEGSQGQFPVDRRSPHARERAAQGRRTGPAFNDAQSAGKNDVFIQPDGRWVVRGPKGREHVFEPDGQHLTSVDRSHKAHQRKVQKGERHLVTDEEFEQFRRLFQ